MPTYARREGGAYARGEPGLARRYCSFEILVDRDLQPRGAVPRARAEGTRQGGLLLRRFELDEARYARRAAVVGQAKSVDRAERLAHRKHGLGQRVEIARFAQLLGDLGLHQLERMLLPAAGGPVSPKA